MRINGLFQVHSYFFFVSPNRVPSNRVVFVYPPIERKNKTKQKTTTTHTHTISDTPSRRKN